LDGEGLVLRELTAHDEAAFLAGLAHWDGEDPHWYSFDWKPGLTFAQLLERERKNSAGLELPEGFVPATMFYGFVGKEIVGRLHVRHILSDSLRYRGGHVGYAVAPDLRGRGYASEMMRQAMPLCRGLGIQELLVTCASDNEASRKIIEKFGGKLENQVWDDVDKEMIKRYWISLTS
jgi:predicted acetyltransferase